MVIYENGLFPVFILKIAVIFPFGISPQREYPIVNFDWLFLEINSQDFKPLNRLRLTTEQFIEMGVDDIGCFISNRD